MPFSPDDEIRENTPTNPPAHGPDNAGDASTSADAPTRVPTDGSAPDDAEAAPIPLGPSIEGYHLKEEIHRGGQGIVYRAIQLGTKREVALKVLLEGALAGKTTRRRFEREVELAASLRHPHIVNILDSGLSFDRYYFAMEFIHGIRLDRYLAQHRPPLDDILRLFIAVCDAVNYAHQRGVIHRDLKPANVLVDPEGQPHILDFGLAKPVHEHAAGDSTMQALSLSGQLLGTIAYMSPEQAAGSHDVDVRSDVYALGMIFYEALVGQPPYVVDGPLGDTLQRIARDEPAHPRQYRHVAPSGQQVDDELATILLKALEKEPVRRYQTAGELARDLTHRLHGEPIEAKRASGLYMLRKMIGRYRWQAAALGLFLVMLLTFLITFAILFTSERQAREHADRLATESLRAERKAREAEHEARIQRRDALRAQDQLRRALVRQHIRRGDLALERAELVDARDSYWRALAVDTSPAAIWALRRYYVQTADHGATLLSLLPHGPTSLSQDAAVAAIASTHETINVLQLATGEPLGWVHAPGPVTQVHVGPDGALAASGENWVRAWPPAQFAPSVAARVDSPADLQALIVTEQAAATFLVEAQRVRLVTGVDSAAELAVPLTGTVSGQPAYHSATGRLAVPTTSGIELVEQTAAGELRSRLVWNATPPIRAVHFADEDVLAVLSTSVHLLTLPQRGSPERFTLIGNTTNWQQMDIRGEAGLVGCAIQTGGQAAYDLGLFSSGDEPRTWPFAVEQIRHLRLKAREDVLVTVDSRDTVTSWVAPERKDHRRLVDNIVPSSWATAADGSVVLLADDRGRLVALNADHDATVRPILRPRLFGLGSTELSLAIDHAGQRAVVRDGTKLRFIELDTPTDVARNWNHTEFVVPERVALSSAGTLAALLSRTQVGERQRVYFMPWPAADRGPLPLADAPPPYELVGALVRSLAFLPHTDELLVARSNGELLRVAPADAAHPGSDPWLKIDAAPVDLAFSRTGEYLAVVADDHVIRVISVPQAAVIHRIPLEQPVASLSFNPRDDVLLTRGTDGAVSLLDPATGERIAHWRLPANTTRPLATWLGTMDAFVFSTDDAVYAYRYATADRLIEHNRPYAVQKRIAQQLAEGDAAAAWEAAVELAELDPAKSLEAQLTIAEVAVRRGSTAYQPAWAETLLEAQQPSRYFRLGHAAYDGEQFEIARRWLHRGRELAAGSLDPTTRLRLAQCDYLAQTYERAAAGFALVLADGALDPGQRPLVALQYTAALLMAEQPHAARAAARDITRQDPGSTTDIVATTFASVIARQITGVARENPQAVALDSLVGSIGVRSLLFRDDEHFFAGELARLRGEDAKATLAYQRCIDLSRDTWPANWARYRLQQMAPAGNDS